MLWIMPGFPSFSYSIVLHWMYAQQGCCMVKNLPAMQETWVLSLSWEDAPEEDMAIHSSILAGKIPWTKVRVFHQNIYYTKAFDSVDHNKLWIILKQMGIPGHLTCLLKILYVGQETTVRTGHGTTDWFKIGKGEQQGCILSSCLFNLYAGCITNWN